MVVLCVWGICLLERRMVDQCKMFAKAGDGGNGCSILRKGRSDGVFSLRLCYDV